ncbi:MAG: TraR/DksA family transcriptional regulator [Kiritimatiellae bacterium]|nr:TraR/DksA family transcriptional regulator [Kiritimatiellia bacterium]
MWVVALRLASLARLHYYADMDAEKRDRYTAMLTALRETLESEIERSRRETAPVQVDGTMGRVSRGDAMQAQQMALEAKRQRELRLQRIQSAFQRIEQGNFGQCPRCGNNISEARLEAFPDAVMCVSCAV